MMNGGESRGENEHFKAEITGWTNVNLRYFPDSIEIVSLEGLLLWCSKLR